MHNVFVRNAHLYTKAVVSLLSYWHSVSQTRFNEDPVQFVSCLWALLPLLAFTFLSFQGEAFLLLQGMMPPPDCFGNISAAMSHRLTVKVLLLRVLLGHYLLSAGLGL